MSITVGSIAANKLYIHYTFQTLIWSYLQNEACEWFQQGHSAMLYRGIIRR